MKRKLRLFASLLLTVMLLTTLSGCVSLDDMRSRHAIRTSSEIIEYNGATYRYVSKAYDYDGVLQPFVSDGAETITITAPDVPLLLTNLFGDTLAITEDGRFLVSEYNYATIYCRTDCYDEIIARAKQPFTPTGYCYEYPTVDEDGRFGSALYHLSDKQAQTIRTILTTVKAESYTYLPEMFETSFVTLQACSDDLLFRRDYVMDIYILEDGYCLALPPDSDEDPAHTLYPVPKQLESAVAELLAPYLKENREELEYYGETYAVPYSM